MPVQALICLVQALSVLSASGLWMGSSVDINEAKPVSKMGSLNIVAAILWASWTWEHF